MSGGTVVVVERADGAHVPALEALFALTGRAQGTPSAPVSSFLSHAQTMRGTIDRCSLGITAQAVSEANAVDVAGLACFADAPDNLAVAPTGRAGSLQSWLDAEFDMGACMPPDDTRAPGLARTVYLTGFVCGLQHQVEVVRTCLEAAFSTMYDVETILLLWDGRNMPPLGAPLSACLRPVARALRATAVPGEFSLFCATRAEHVPRLKMRAAHVEDNDDLIPVFDRQSDVLSARYGPFFLASLIEAQDGDNVAVVAEVGGLAVGLMAVCADIAIDTLAACFDLSPYNRLLRPAAGWGPVPPQTDGDGESADAGAAADAAGAGAGAGEGMSALEAADAAAARAAAAAAAASPSPAAKEIDFLALSVDVDRSPAQGAASGGGAGVTPGVTPGASGESLRFAASKSSLRQSSSDLRGTAAHAAPTTGRSGAGPSLAPGRSVVIATPVSTSSSDGASNSDGDDSSSPPSSARSGDGSLLVPNALAVTLFCLDERYEARTVDFLVHVFALFPERDYLVLTLPRTTPDFALLQHFARVDPAPGSAFPHLLYVLHRAALTSRLRVRRARDSDKDAARQLLMGVDGEADVAKRFSDILRLEQEEKLQRHTFDSLTDRAFVVEADSQLVGLLLVSSELNMTALRGAFQLDEVLHLDAHRTAEHLYLTDAILSPTFLSRGRTVLADLLRAAGKTLLLVRMFRGSLVPPLLDEFVQVRPRRVQTLRPPFDKRVYGAEAAAVASGHSHAHALFLFTRKLTYERRIAVNELVVFVGASETTLACLEALLLTPHLRFTNLVLVSPNGLPTLEPAVLGSFLPLSLAYSARVLQQIAHPLGVTVVRETVVHIARASRSLLLSNGAVVPYDRLVLATGRQFRLPLTLNPLAAAGDDSGVGAGLGGGGGGGGGGDDDDQLQHGAACPTGVVSLNDEHDVEALTALLQAHVIKRKERVAVYGASLEAYAALQGLLARGVPAAQITLVLPASRELAASCFNEFAVDEYVASVLQSAGVRVIHGLDAVELVHSGGALTGLVLRAAPVADDVAETGGVAAASGAQSDSVHLACAVLVWAHTRAVDPAMFAAINSSSLVYDGALVVDTSYRTVDAAIYAAGPLTKFSRRFAAQDLDETCAASSDRGMKLAAALLAELDPLGPGPSVGPAALPVYTMPVAVQLSLPGPMCYFHFEGPKRTISLALASSSPNYGRDITTHGATGYARLHVDGYGRVEAATYLGPDHEIESLNLLQLFGLPVSYLNGLEERVASGRVSDIVAFLREPWATALFNDRFFDLRNEVTRVLDGTEAMAFVRDKLRSWSESGVGALTDKHMDLLRTELSNADAQNALLTTLYEFLRANGDMLPMYHVPAVHYVASGRYQPAPKE